MCYFNNCKIFKTINVTMNNKTKHTNFVLYNQNNMNRALLLTTVNSQPPFILLNTIIKVLSKTYLTLISTTKGNISAIYLNLGLTKVTICF